MKNAAWVVRCAAVMFVLGGLLVALSAPLCTECYMTRYWQVPSITATESEQFPELDSTRSLEALRLKGLPSIGLAFSGGGTRSATATMGQLRGLEHLGWLKSVRYISAVSGGAWAPIPFVYSAQSSDELLGKFEQPGALDPGAVKSKPNGSLARAIAESSLTASTIREAALIAASAAGRSISESDVSDITSDIGGLVKSLRPYGKSWNKTFSRLLADTFIDPLIDKHASKDWFAWDDASRMEMSDRNPGRMGPFLTTHRKRPFMIISGTAVSNRNDYQFPLAMPVEYTPLYVGIRRQFAGQYGGGYVWPFAYDAASLAGNGAYGPDRTIQVRLEQDHRFTLADVAASTGAAPDLFLVLGGPQEIPAAVRSKLQIGASFFPSFRHIGLHEPLPSVTFGMPHVDGGALDNLGVMPLLARGVQNILVFVNTSNPLVDRNEDVKSLFGLATKATAVNGDKRFNTVFEPQRLEEVTDALVTAREREEPQVYCGADWRVLPNEFYNIRGYSGLSICFFYNANVTNWQNKLNFDVLKLLKEKPKGVVTERAQWMASRNRFNFPWFKTFGQDKGHLIKLSLTEVNLLASLTAWTVASPDVVRAVRKAIPALPEPERGGAGTKPDGR